MVLDLILEILNEGSWPWNLKRSNIGQIAGKMISKKIGVVQSMPLKGRSEAQHHSKAHLNGVAVLHSVQHAELCSLFPLLLSRNSRDWRSGVLPSGPPSIRATIYTLTLCYNRLLYRVRELRSIKIKHFTYNFNPPMMIIWQLAGHALCKDNRCRIF